MERKKNKKLSISGEQTKFFNFVEFLLFFELFGYFFIFMISD